MKNQTQENFVINELKKNGFISRNLCLQNYITRLGAIICDLKKEGFNFSSGYVKTGYLIVGKDFVYHLENKDILQKKLF